MKVGDKDAKHGLEVLNKYKEHLESFQNASSAPVSEEDKKYVADLFLISTKPIIYVCNVDEASALNGNAYVEQVREYLKDEPTEILIIAGKIEADIAELDEEEDRKEFLKEVGLLEPGVNSIRAAYSLLDLETFFTVAQRR